MPFHVLITGGAGFIGAHLTRKLLSKDYIVSVIDNLSPQVHGDQPALTSHSFRDFPPEVEFVQQDIRSSPRLQELVDQSDAIVHLAAETGTGQSMYEADKYASVNVEGTRRLLEAVARKKGSLKSFILTSSRAVYGEGKYRCKTHGDIYPKTRDPSQLKLGQFEPLCPNCDQSLTAKSTDEDAPLNPLSVYASTKEDQEILLRNASISYGLNATILRLQNVYGPGQSLSNPYTGILAIFSNRIRQGVSINIFEDGEESRDFIHVDDVSNSICQILDHPTKGLEIYNLGTGVQTSVIELVQLLMEKFGQTVQIDISKQFRDGDIRHNFSNSKKFESTFGTRPVTNFSEGLSNYVDWVVRQELFEDHYEESLHELTERGLLK
ncbi:MAG: NAD-dependent epimerase/dehydratase family protein [Pseudomonadales bacterium]|nr:NAD-dependent epimerase/dehydratase family protein [Pseudomonadales bacterium]